MSEMLDSTDARTLDMIYTIEDTPPWYLCVFLGLQVNLHAELIWIMNIFEKMSELAMCRHKSWIASAPPWIITVSQILRRGCICHPGAVFFIRPRSPHNWTPVPKRVFCSQGASCWFKMELMTILQIMSLSAIAWRNTESLSWCHVVSIVSLNSGGFPLRPSQ